jgi:ABC-2 type transport system ATP-binding protein
VEAATVREGTIELIVDHAGAVLVELLGTVAAAGVDVKAVEIDEPDLEAVFLHLTGRALRD